ncbi:SDR family oxidoreductase [Azospirillum canadense]|nr:NAD(P)-dependent dehydrogenase (short-subunit alcohol dehydrogenase family) [Azospirillum canadense]
MTAGGSGMGAASARKLAAEGFKVAILSSSGKGEALAKELGGLGVTGSNQSNEYQYAADNVRMNNVLPGWIDRLPAVEERRQGVPMMRYGTAEEIAATVAFLASPGAGYITGQNIRVDGGLGRSV